MAQTTIPGLIPQFYSIEAATDLPLSAEEAHEAALNGSLDISLLDPDQTTNMWSPEQNTIKKNELLSPNDSVTFTGELKSRTGILRFTVQNKNGDDFIIYLSKKAHNILLRKNILEKIGYNVPPISWTPTLRVTFNNSIDHDLFIEEMKDQLLGSKDRFILHDNNLTIDLQDALVLTPESEIYNLALGIMNRGVHRGRRLLRAPYVAIALVDTPESVNLMPWQAGRVIMNQVKLYHTLDVEREYDTSFEDAKWIMRRIAKLNRHDIEEIVRLAYYPKPVELLLTEKIISRRNDMNLLFKIEPEFQNISFNPNISYSSDLVDGEIETEFFDGYASRYSFGDPESPFSTSEMGAYVFSRIQDQIFQYALTGINKLISTQDDKLYEDKMREVMSKNKSFQPVNTVVIPSVHGSTILSRDIVTGSYLGTSHKVQLVDNIGFNFDAGILLGIEGLPVPVKVFGKTSLTLQRLYSHIKPVQSLKKSMKEPYKNLIVPALLNKIAENIDELTTTDSQDQAARITTVIEALKKSMGIGESFVVTDSIVPSFGVQASANLSEWIVGSGDLVEMYTNFSTSRVMLSRFHLFRANENTFHIYQDYGRSLQMVMSFGLNAAVPVVRFQGNWSKINVETHYYPIELQASKTSVDTLKAFRASLLATNHKALQEIVKPHIIEHKIKEKLKAFQFFFFKKNKIGSNDDIQAHHAEGGDDIEIQRRYDSVTKGIDKENFAIETLNEIISKMLKSSTLNIDMSPALNPGFTLGGRAKNSVFVSEASDERIITKYERIFNGWRADRSRLRKMVKEINAEYGSDLFEQLSIKDVTAILLYRIQITTIITQEGTNNLIAMDELQLNNLIRNFSIQNITEKRVSFIVSKWKKMLTDIQRLKNNHDDALLEKYHKFLLSLLDSITIEGLKTIAGHDNVVVQGRIDGFRQGEENGDSPIFTDVTGALPLPLHQMPSEKIMSNTGILEGELLGNWISLKAI
ncbi:MAG: hypothetical protein KDD38_01305 [Bdellovibrionales bacterium]|nr:hypothetical protein [Bdellovibrionales bacterium]